MTGKLIGELSTGIKRNYLTKAQKSSDDLMNKGNELINKGDEKSGVKALYKSGKRQEAVNKTRGKVKGSGLSVVKEAEVIDLLHHAIEKQPIEFYEVMNSLLADKIEPMLAAIKQDMAQNILNDIEEPVMEEKDEDEPADSKNSEKNKRDNRFNLKKKFKEKLSKKDRDWD